MALINLIADLTLQREQRSAVDPNATPMLRQVEAFLAKDEDLRPYYNTVCSLSKKLVTKYGYRHNPY